MRYFLELTYKGTRYHGWQVQENAPSVQAELERALTMLLRERIIVTGCGRTDSGVHAYRYMVHFDVEKAIAYEDFVRRINGVLANDIAVHRCFEVADDLHARYSAVQRTYRYFIHTEKDPFLDDRSYYYRYRAMPDIQLMNDFCRELYAIQDFAPFEKLGSNIGHSLCTLYHAEWTAQAKGWMFEITANRFLYNMVRFIVGTCLDIGTGRKTIEETMIDVRDGVKMNVHLAAPAHGLYLWKIDYPDFSTLP